MGALLASLFTPGLPYRVWDRAAERLEEPPPLEEAIVRTYIEQTETANIWSQPPVVWPASVEYFRRNFTELDPRRPHPFEDVDHPYGRRLVPELVTSGGLYSGIPLVTFGEIRTMNIFGPASGLNLEWIVQIKPASFDDRIGVYCRVTAPLEPSFRPGELVFARGILLASGAVWIQRGGSAQVAYMACSSIAKPKGPYGSGELPPIPGSPDRRPGRTVLVPPLSMVPFVPVEVWRKLGSPVS